MTRILALAGIVVVVTIWACGGGGPAKTCTPGQSVACVGEGACQGGQTCKADGSGFNPCQCGGGSGAGGTSGPGGGAGTASGGTSGAGGNGGAGGVAGGAAGTTAAAGGAAGGAAGATAGAGGTTGGAAGATGGTGDPSSGTGGSNGPDGGAGGAGASVTVKLTVAPTSITAGQSTAGTIAVTNFVLEQPSGQPDTAGHGHYHIYLDANTGGNYLVDGFMTSTTIGIPGGTQAGPHTLRIVLTENSHAPLSPPVSDTIPIMVQ